MSVKQMNLFMTDAVLNPEKKPSDVPFEVNESMLTL